MKKGTLKITRELLTQLLTSQKGSKFDFEIVATDIPPDATIIGMGLDRNGDGYFTLQSEQLPEEYKVNTGDEPRQFRGPTFGKENAPTVFATVEECKAKYPPPKYRVLDVSYWKDREIIPQYVPGLRQEWEGSPFAW